MRTLSLLIGLIALAFLICECRFIPLNVYLETRSWGGDYRLCLHRCSEGFRNELLLCDSTFTCDLREREPCKLIEECEGVQFRLLSACRAQCDTIASAIEEGRSTAEAFKNVGL